MTQISNPRSNQDKILGAYSQHRVENNMHIPWIHKARSTRADPSSSIHVEELSCAHLGSFQAHQALY